MPRIPTVDRHQASPELGATLDAVKAKLGKVPNLFATFAQSPAVLNAYLGFSEALAKGKLSARQREVIALAAAQANACQYCLSAHSLMSKGAGLSEADIQAARAGEAADAQTGAIARLTAQIVSQRGVVSDQDLAAARAAGVDDGLLVEVIAAVALNTLTNYANLIAGTEIDFPVVDL